MDLRKEYEKLKKKAASSADLAVNNNYEFNGYVTSDIERAKTYTQFSQTDDELWDLSADINICAKKYADALEDIMRAIEINGKNAAYYRKKAAIEEIRYLDSKHEDADASREWLFAARDDLSRAIKIAEQANDKKEENRSRDLLAFSLYFHEPTDKEYAQKTAEELIGPDKDLPMSDRIIKDIKERELMRKQQEDDLWKKYNECFDKGDFSSALDHIDRLISLYSGNIYYYLERGVVYQRLSNDKTVPDIAADFERKSREEFKAAIDKAEKANDAGTKATAQGALGRALYFRDPKDKAAGERLAREAYESGKDRWGNSKKVIEAIQNGG